jgi:hypothetical protein
MQGVRLAELTWEQATMAQDIVVFLRDFARLP